MRRGVLAARKLQQVNHIGGETEAVAELLKRQGYEVFGLYMDNSTDEARLDAVKTAEFIGIPLRVLDVRERLERCVCAPFAQSYLSGESPKPLSCLMRNSDVDWYTGEAMQR